VLASCAIVTRRGSVLLTRRAHAPSAGLWDLPGGFLEAGETPEEALRRELREELGVELRYARLVGFEPDRYGPDGFPTLTAVYRTGLVPGPMRCADDVSEVRWTGSRLPIDAAGAQDLSRVEAVPPINN
jgi:8-oxo-dGTP diphosphatase